MATISQVLQNAKNARDFSRGVINGIIEDHSEILSDYNRDQLLRGYDRNGERLDPYKSLTYALWKYQKNPLAGLNNPDLNLTGAFYRGFFVNIKGDSFEISSTDEKTGDLKSKYGPMIFGLSNQSLSLYTKNEFFEEFKSFIENTLKLKMQ